MAPIEAVSETGPEQSFPSAAMSQYSGTVNLPAYHGSPRVRSEIFLQPRPSRHDFSNRIGTSQAERSGFPRRRESVNAKPRELGNILAGNRNLGAHLRRSATRSTDAPSCRRR